ncbi:hypothetical protein J5N97_028871 [Dioscorea zingiberensis]|uniref:Protein kinase domain-containing protein n=1 Tax=Dioscorea zingiberensis TaxID=325984 RepID=A0A9D5C019_9LILI|nr:hypothetical protein J5N97_028871 [Dioscorea zingiberensis]
MSDQLNKDYDVGALIGRGRFGAVFRCVSRISGELFAVKSIDKALLTDPLDYDPSREAKLHRLAAAGNPLAVQIHADYEDDESIHLVLDFCHGPNLFHHIADKGAPISEPEAAMLMGDLMEAIAACHRRGVVHRDVKPENAVFDGAGRIRIVDFGSAGWIGEGGGMRELVGTPFYMAPEVERGEVYGEKVDVWSAGVVLFTMLGGLPPSYCETSAEIFEAVRWGSLRFPSRVFSGVSSAAKDLLERMICKEVSRRFSAEQVLRHPWIKSREVEAVLNADFFGVVGVDGDAGQRGLIAKLAEQAERYEEERKESSKAVAKGKGVEKIGQNKGDVKEAQSLRG